MTRMNLFCRFKLQTTRLAWTTIKHTCQRLIVLKLEGYINNSNTNNN